jgi:hypothetical protein
LPERRFSKMRQTNQEDQEKGGNGKVGAKGKDLLHVAGLIEEDDLRLMEEAIERDCEKVALDEW